MKFHSMSKEEQEVMRRALLKAVTVIDWAAPEKKWYEKLWRKLRTQFMRD